MKKHNLEVNNQLIVYGNDQRRLGVALHDVVKRHYNESGIHTYRVEIFQSITRVLHGRDAVASTMLLNKGNRSILFSKLGLAFLIT